ncbi:YeeE/YedE family protein [Oceanibium sediminis]|uniref:YeeE/YedE family protein n=1 Tax=Oceanibium sediminis TaxID=2026339 RepID=UPI000DD44045|nr:YeeE/YedE family protein [Oceanibium sediminis]
MENTARLPVLFATAGLIFVAVMAYVNRGGSLALATLVGGFAGFALYHASFGFTAGWRRIISERRSTGLRAQFMLIALTALVSYPLIAWGGAYAWVQPISVSLVVGAFLFGMGMQLGGGCGSGTLFVVGGGSTRMVITLLFFIIGSVIGVAHIGFWWNLPSAGRVSLLNEFGPVTAFLILIAILGALAYGAMQLEKRAHGSLEPARKTGSLIRGPWSPWMGAVALAAVGILTFLVLNRPWGITQAFGFWGAKAAYVAGVPTDVWFLEPWSEKRLNQSVFADSTSVMDFGIILGAMLAASLAGKWKPVWSLSASEIGTAVVGGLLMGYGARLGFGCNIGAYLGGLVSGSMHAWVWAAAAFAGSTVIVKWRMPRAPATPQNAPS